MTDRQFESISRKFEESVLKAGWTQEQLDEFGYYDNIDDYTWVFEDDREKVYKATYDKTKRKWAFTPWHKPKY